MEEVVLRLSDSEMKLFKKFAKIENKEVEKMVEDAVLEKIESCLDDLNKQVNSVADFDEEIADIFADYMECTETLPDCELPF